MATAATGPSSSYAALLLPRVPQAVGRTTRNRRGCPSVVHKGADDASTDTGDSMTAGCKTVSERKLDRTGWSRA